MFNKPGGGGSIFSQGQGQGQGQTVNIFNKPQGGTQGGGLFSQGQGQTGGQQRNHCLI